MTRREEIIAAGRGGNPPGLAKGRRRRQLTEQVSARRHTRPEGGPSFRNAGLGDVAMLANRMQRAQTAAGGIQRLPAGGLPQQASQQQRGPLAPGRPGRRVGQARVSGAMQPGLGNQLSRRVAAGEIDQTQAQRTSNERAELKTAFGPDWRQKIYGEDVQALRQGLAGAHKGDPRYQGAMKVVMDARKKALERARAKAGKAVSSARPVY